MKVYDKVRGFNILICRKSNKYCGLVVWKKELMR
jgi:hypothetical protein